MCYSAQPFCCTLLDIAGVGGGSCCSADSDDSDDNDHAEVTVQRFDVDTLILSITDRHRFRVPAPLGDDQRDLARAAGASSRFLECHVDPSEGGDFRLGGAMGSMNR